MADTKTNYRLAEEKARKRLGELVQSSDGIPDLANEIGLIRMLIEEQVQNPGDRGAVQLTTGLLQALDRLVKCQFQIAVRRGDLLPRDKVLEIAQQLVEILTTELRGVDNWEAIVDKIVGRFAEAIGSAKNE